MKHPNQLDLTVLAFLTGRRALVGARVVDGEQAPILPHYSSPVGAYPTNVAQMCGLPFHPTINVLFQKRLMEFLHPRYRGESYSVERDSALDKARQQLSVIKLFLADVGQTDPVTTSAAGKFVSKLSVLNFMDLGETYLKWKFAHIACAALHQNEFPEPPSWVHPDDHPEKLLGGSTCRFLRRKIYERDYSLGWNISQLKKGMPIVSDRAVKLAVKKTIAALTSRAPAQVSTPDETWTSLSDPMDFDSNTSPRDAPLELSCEDLVYEVRRSVRELYPSGWSKDLPLYTPSISGHFLTKRKNVGAMGALVRHRCSEGQEYLSIFIRTIPGVRRNDRDDARMRAELSFTGCPNCDHRQFDRFCSNCGWHPSDSVLSIDVPSEVSTILTDSISYDAHHPASDLNCVRAVGLKEPFKVRTITGGPEGRYYRSKYIQKATHRHLRRHPNASLIGEVLSAERLDEVLHLPGKDQFYVSGDYSSATDNIDPRLSEAVCDEIGRQGHWSQAWIDLFVDSLTKHRILRDEVNVKRLKTASDLLKNSLPQTWGQLMGSPASFVVLCIINLALSRRALEIREKKQIRIRDSGILINGDDIAFVTDRPGYDIWKRVTALGGLSPSLGKNFCSDDFVVLNSTFHDVSVVDGVRTFTYRPYINYGLTMCRNENGTPIADLAESLLPSSDPRTPGIGALAHDLVKGHPEEVQVMLLKRFVAGWAPALQKFTPNGMSWYMPTHLGGLGLPLVGEFHSKSYDTRFSRSQRVLASFLSHDPEKFELLSGPTTLGRSDSLNLWNMCSSTVRRLMSSVTYRWTKETLRPDHSGSVTAPLLVGAYTKLTSQHVVNALAEDEETEQMVQECRYRQWREAFERLFKTAEKTTYAPLSDEEIVTDTPWRKVYNDFIVVDPSPRVDLTCPPDQQLEVKWNNATHTLVAIDQDPEDPYSSDL